MNMIGKLTLSTHQSLVTNWYLKHCVIVLADLQKLELYYVYIQKGWILFIKLIQKDWKHLFWANKFVTKWKYQTKNQRFHFCARWISKSCTKCAKFDIPLKNDATSVYCNFKFFINWGSFGILHCFMISHVSNLSMLLLVLVILILIWIRNSFKKQDESFFLDWRSLKKS